jgi:hypothetical protein
LTRASRPLSAALAAVLLALAASVGRAQAPVDLEIFVHAGCPHCARAEAWAAAVAHQRPELRIRIVDVGVDTAARARLLRLAAERGVTALGVPAFDVAGRLWVGFEDSTTTGRALLRLLEPTAPRPPDEVETPLFGRLSASRLGLPLFTLLLGFADGLNPCAMWALLFVLSLLVNLGSRWKMLVIGGTFVAVGGLLYFAFLAAWLELFLAIGLSRPLELTLGLVALGVGALNLKDAGAWEWGPSLKIPNAAKPGLYARARRVLTAPNLPAALAAAALLSVMVNIVELLCTAGLPAVYTEVLAAHNLGRWPYYGYLGLYILAYVVDDTLVLGVAVATLGRRKLQERGGRVLKLLSGAVMVALGLLLVFQPGWLR